MSATKTAREEKGKTSFIIECDDLKVIAGFTNEQKGKVLTYITDFAMNDKEPDITTVEGMAASFFTKTIEKYNHRYLEICQKNADNRSKGKNKEKDKGEKER